MAERSVAVGVELHVEGDGAAGLGAAADVVELEAHERLNERALPVGLVANHQHRRGVERRGELLGEAVQLIVGFVEFPVAIFHHFGAAIFETCVHVRLGVGERVTVVRVSI